MSQGLDIGAGTFDLLLAFYDIIPFFVAAFCSVICDL